MLLFSGVFMGGIEHLTLQVVPHMVGAMDGVQEK